MTACWSERAKNSALVYSIQFIQNVYLSFMLGYFCLSITILLFVTIRAFEKTYIFEVAIFCLII